jgi:NADH:ubiquinone oxidoreductase subunit 6 (subunit J)
MIYFTMTLILLFTIVAILLRNNLLSVLSLAVVSALLAIVFFQLGAPVAGTFELSVGAGLITVLIILTISFIQTKKQNKRDYSLIWIGASLAVAAIFFYFLQILTSVSFASQTSTPGNWGSVGEVLWKERVFDLFPQALIIIAAVFGILALLRTEKGGHHQ